MGQYWFFTVQCQVTDLEGTFNFWNCLYFVIIFTRRVAVLDLLYGGDEMVARG